MNPFICFFTGGLLTACAALLLCLKERKRRLQRLSGLCSYLEAASCGRENALTRTEDEFSLLEDELYKTVSELCVAREQAQQARLRQADNLADIAHQLKTPLTSMSLMTQLISAEASPEQLLYTGRIDRQLARLSWLTDSLLTMSKLDAGAIAFTPVSLTFEELAARALEPAEPLLREKKQTVSVLGGEVTLSCDPHWTAEALVNLVKNCCEHTPVGGAVLLTALFTPLYLQITVEDNGPGFDPEELPRLFERFFRGKNSAKDSIGIGLSLSRAILEGQGGLLRVENRTEGGARFTIRFYP